MKTTLNLCALVFLYGSCLCSENEDTVQRVELSILPETETTPSRIIGGTPAPITKFPFAVQLIRGNALICGGSLITRRTVLTAAHCFFDDNGNLVSYSNYRVRAGSANNNQGGTIHNVNRVIIHERYDIPLRSNDVAVLRTSSQFTLNNQIRIASLPFPNAVVPVNASVTYIGWGAITPGSIQTSPVLLEVTVRKVALNVCRARYQQLQQQTNQPFPVTDGMLCAGLLDVGGADACQGDSGSALMYGNVVVGVVSWGAGCALPLYPGVSARVATYSNWIDSAVAVLNGGPSSVQNSSALLLGLFATVILSAFYN